MTHPNPSLPGAVTVILHQLNQGRTGAVYDLMPLVYDELYRIADRHFKRERHNHTLQPTALINEIYLRMVDSHGLRFENRGQFFQFAAVLMRRILVDHARTRKARKRGDDFEHLPFEEELVVQAGDVALDPAMLIAIDEALEKLSKRDFRQSQVVEMRFFAGLSIQEVAELLQVSSTIIKQEWRLAKAWLVREMGHEISPAPVFGAGA